VCCWKKRPSDATSFQIRTRPETPVQPRNRVPICAESGAKRVTFHAVPSVAQVFDPRAMRCRSSPQMTSPQDDSGP